MTQRTMFDTFAATDVGMARRSDPQTSKIAAAMAAGSRSPSQAAVWDVMKDGLERIDEEIEEQALRQGCRLSDTRLRHGRRELVDMGVLRIAPATRETKRGRPATVFVRATGSQQ